MSEREERGEAEEAHGSSPKVTVRPAGVSPLAETFAGPSSDSGEASLDSLKEPTGARYDISDELGRGGLGRVLRAYDRKLRRTVALKELKTPSSTDASRFVREAHLTARLEHPNIVPLYDAAIGPDGQPFYTMRLLPTGATLEEHLARSASLETSLALVPQVLAAANALAYAHGLGIVHRDVKPENILIGEHGESFVIDWGIAKAIGDLESDSPAPTGPSAELSNLTQAGDLLGSPAYMPPEQARGETVDARADVFSLGGVLYRLLAGRAPYDTSSNSGLIRILDGDYPPIHVVAPGAPPELMAIVRKAMAVRPEQRYETARDVAADLSRFLSGQIVSAHQYTRWALWARWMVRHQKAVRVAAVGIATGVVIATIALVNQVRARRDADAARDRAVAAQARAEAEQRSAEEGRRRLILVQARTSLDLDPTATVAWLKSLPADAPEQDEARRLRLDAEARGVARHVIGMLPRRVQRLAFSPDDSLVAAYVDGGTVLLTDTRTGQARRVLHNPSYNSVSFTARGRVVIGGWDGTITLLDDVRAEPRRISGVGSSPYWFALLPGSERLAFSDGDGNLKVLDAETGHLQVLRKDLGSVLDGFQHTTYDPIGRYIAGFDIASGTTRVFSPNGSSLREWRGLKTGNLRIGINVSSKGEYIGLALQDGVVRVLEPQTGRERIVAKHTDAVTSLSFAPDGSAIVSGARDGTLTSSSPIDSTTRWTTRLPAPIGMVRHFPDGSVAVTVEDDTVRLFDYAGNPRGTLRGHGLPLRLEISNDGRLLATSGQDRTIRIWSVTSSREQVVRGHKSDLNGVGFFADGSVVSGGLDGTVMLSSAAASASVKVAQAAGQLLQLETYRAAHALYFSQREIGLVSPSPPKVQKLPLDNTEAVAGTVLPDGRAIVLTDNGKLHEWVPDTGASRVLDELRPQQGLAQGGTVTIEPSKGLLAYSLDGDAVFVRTGADLEMRVSLADARGPFLRLEFEPGGERLVGVNRRGEVSTWLVASGRLASRSDTQEEPPNIATFAKDARYVLLGTRSGFLHILDRLTGAHVKKRAHESPMACIVVNPSRDLFVTCGMDRVARFWSLPAGEQLDAIHFSSAVQRAAFDKNGSTVALGGWDRFVHVIPLDDRPGLQGAPRPPMGEVTTSVSSDDHSQRMPLTPSSVDVGPQ